jgi:small subunit ribosomal protein S18
MAEFRKKRKKVCYMCLGKPVDYKDINVISKYINDSGKILPRRFTGTCACHQRHVAEQVKLARFMGFIPYTTK